MKKSEERAFLLLFCAVSLVHVLILFVFHQKEKPQRPHENRHFVRLKKRPPKPEKEKEKKSTKAAKARPEIKRKKLKTQVVHHTPAEMKKKVETRFLSKENNYHARQSVSKNSGLYRNAGQGVRDGTMIEVPGPTKKKSETKKKRSARDFALLQKKDLFVEKTANDEQEKLSKKGLENGRSKKAGLSQTNDFIEDVRVGDFNRVNTQEYEFYGFYFRIRQRLEQFWGRTIQEKARAMVRSGRTLASGKNHVTSLKVFLDSRGRIRKIKVESASGVKELDDAAVESFNQAGPFPNPPKGMLRKGLARLEWGFVVKS